VRLLSYGKEIRGQFEKGERERDGERVLLLFSLRGTFIRTSALHQRRGAARGDPRRLAAASPPISARRIPRGGAAATAA